MLEKDFIVIYDLVGKIIQTHQESLFTDQELSQLTIRQINYLKIIGKLKNPTLTDLAHAFKITKPSVTAVIQILSDLDYVKKVHSTTDMRVYTAQLTPKGIRMAHVDDEGILEFCSQVHSVLSEKEEADLGFLMAKIIHAIA